MSKEAMTRAEFDEKVAKIERIIAEEAAGLASLLGPVSDATKALALSTVLTSRLATVMANQAMLIEHVSMLAKHHSALQALEAMPAGGWE